MKSQEQQNVKDAGIAIADQVSKVHNKNKAESLNPPKTGNSSVNQRQVIQAKCGNDSAGGDKMNDEFSKISSRNDSKERPFSLQRKLM